MKKEIIHRLTRIIIVITFLIVASLARNITFESYEEASKITNSISNSLKVVKLQNSDTKNIPASNKQTSQNKEYKLKISNTNKQDKTFTIALINNIDNKENKIPNKVVKYQIIKDNKILITDNLKENGYLYKETLKGEKTSTYEIKFWIDKNIKTDLNNKTFSSKIALI